MPATKPAYPEEFKAESVRLYKQSDKGMKEVAEDLGMSVNSLQAWLRRSESSEADSAPTTESEDEELQRLRKENRILREEREILKKATVNSIGRRNTSMEVEIWDVQRVGVQLKLAGR